MGFHEATKCTWKVSRELCVISSGDRDHAPRRAHPTCRRVNVADDPEVPDIQKRITLGRVEYSRCQSRFFSLRSLHRYFRPPNLFGKVMDTNAFLTWLSANWFGIAAVIIGLMTSIFFYRRQDKSKKPVYAIKTKVIIENAKEVIPSISVHYKGVGGNLDNLSVSFVAIWNAEKGTINASDITEAKPLQIIAKEGVTILGCSIVDNNNVASSPKCEFSKLKNTANLTFAYLDYKQGFVVEVFHTGVKRGDIKVVGVFKEAGEIVEYEYGATSVGQQSVKIFKFASGIYGLILLTFVTVTLTAISKIEEATHPPYFKMKIWRVNGVRCVQLPDSYEAVLNSDGVMNFQRDYYSSYAPACILIAATLFCVYKLYKASRIGVPNSLDRLFR